AAALRAVAAAAGALLAGLRLVDGQGTALELGAVQVADGLLGPFGHLDEAEAARAAGLPVRDNLGTGDLAVLAEGFAKVVRGGLEGKVPDVQILAHATPHRVLRTRVQTDTNSHNRPRAARKTGATQQVPA